MNARPEDTECYLSRPGGLTYGPGRRRRERDKANLSFCSSNSSSSSFRDPADAPGCRLTPCTFIFFGRSVLVVFSLSSSKMIASSSPQPVDAFCPLVWQHPLLFIRLISTPGRSHPIGPEGGGYLNILGDRMNE